MRGVLTFVLLALTIGAARLSLQLAEEPQQVHPPQRLWSRIFRWAAKIATAALALATLAQTIVDVRGPFWPTDPEVHPRDTNGSLFVLPFAIRNPAAFGLNPVTLRCGIDFAYAVDAKGQTVVLGDMAFETGSYDIAHGQSASFKCDASDILQTNPDGTLSPYGSATQLSNQDGTKPRYFPPLKVLKMCVWVGGEYQYLWWKHHFESPIDQWPAAPNSPQWIEGPLLYGGLDDPFKLAWPDRFFAMRNLAVTNLSLQCSGKIHYPYGVAIGKGRLRLIPKPDLE